MKKLIILPLIFLLSSCVGIDRNSFDGLFSEVTGVLPNTDNDTHYFIVIPGQGCSGCLQKAGEFMMKHHNKDSYTFIMTKFDSVKGLKLRFGKEPIEQAVIDKQNVFYNGGFNSMYPAIVAYSDNEFSINLADPYNFELWDEIGAVVN